MSNVTIEVFIKLSPELKTKVKELKHLCFGWENKLAPENFAEHIDRFCSHKDIFKEILAFEADKVAGTARVLKRKIVYEGKNITLGGIGGMAVNPKWRHKGIAGKMLKRAILELKKSGCDIAYLCTDLTKTWLVKFYGKAGFVPLGRPHTYQGKSGKRYTDRDAMIAPVNSQQMFQFVMKQKSPFDIGVGNW